MSISVFYPLISDTDSAAVVFSSVVCCVYSIRSLYYPNVFHGKTKKSRITRQKKQQHINSFYKDLPNENRYIISIVRWIHERAVCVACVLYSLHLHLSLCVSFSLSVCVCIQITSIIDNGYYFTSELIFYWMLLLIFLHSPCPSFALCLHILFVCICDGIWPVRGRPFQSFAASRVHKFDLFIFNACSIYILFAYWLHHRYTAIQSTQISYYYWSIRFKHFIFHRFSCKWWLLHMIFSR